MEPESGGRIQIEIHVVNEVEAPEPRYTVHHDVPKIQRVVEQKDGHYPAQPRRPADRVRESPPTPGDCPRKGHDDGRLQQLHGHGGDAGEGQVPRRVCGLGFHIRARPVPALHYEHHGRSGQHQAPANQVTTAHQRSPVSAFPPSDQAPMANG